LFTSVIDDMNRKFMLTNFIISTHFDHDFMTFTLFLKQKKSQNSVKMILRVGVKPVYFFFHVCVKPNSRTFYAKNGRYIRVCWDYQND